MPMLTTLRTGSPVAPFQWPARTRSANTDIRFSTSCTSETTSAPSTSMRDPTGARCAEGGGPLLLQPERERVEVDACLGESGERLIDVSAVVGEQATQVPVVGEGEQRRVRHRVDRQLRRERLDVEDVGSGRVLGAGARKQQTLRIGASVLQAPPPFGGEQLTVGGIGLGCDGNA